MKCDEDSACVSFTLVLNTDMCYLFADVGSGGVPYSVSLAGYKGGNLSRNFHSMYEKYELF